MGTVELLLFLIFALVYLAIPVIILVIVVRINNRLKQIEQDLKLKLKSSYLTVFNKSEWKHPFGRLRTSQSGMTCAQDAHSSFFYQSVI